MPSDQSEKGVSRGARALRILEKDADRHNYDMWEEAEAKFRSEDLELLRALASRAGIDTTGSHPELAKRLADAKVFLGPIGDECYYQKRKCEVVTFGDPRRLAGKETTPMGAREGGPSCV